MAPVMVCEDAVDAEESIDFGRVRCGCWWFGMGWMDIAVEDEMREGVEGGEYLTWMEGIM